jgi:acetyl-CoA synthetase
VNDEVTMTHSIEIKNLDDYQRVYNYSLKNNSDFWSRVAKQQLLWRKPWTTVSECDYHDGKTAWYVGGKLNVAENCVDRHLNSGRRNKKALIWVGNEPGEEQIYTFHQLYEEVCRFSHALESLGVTKGDRIGIYLPNIPELAFAMLACARIGAIHSVVFGGFSAHSIQTRMNDCGAKLIITSNGVLRGDKWIDLKLNVDAALAEGCESIERVLVISHRSGRPWTRKPKDLAWEEVIQPFRPHSVPTHDAEDPLFILYTSGSTGQPKGVLHTMGGYLTYASYTHSLVFQPQETDTYWCTADLGWVTGHSYLLYGPLANGVTTVMYEGIPQYPNASRLWEITDQHGVNIFYTAPTAIRFLASLGAGPVAKTSRKTLRTLGTVGEPINPEAWRWYSSVVGENRCPIVDTWWQTETGGIMISPLSGITPTRPGSATLPLPGIEPKIVNQQGERLKIDEAGALVITRSWPGQMRGVYGDSTKCFETYFKDYPGNYYTGDSSRRDSENYYWILGRMDDVIKISGHRLGTAEIESACILHPDVIESAAIGVHDDITGEALHVFVVTQAGFEHTAALSENLTQLIRKEVGPLATPKKIHFVPNLPKTRSGKIMRRILKKIAVHDFENLGDISTLADPAVIEPIKQAVKAEM